MPTLKLLFHKSTVFFRKNNKLSKRIPFRNVFVPLIENKNTFMNEYFPSKVLHFCPFCGADAFRPGDGHYLQCGVCGKKLYINAAGAVACIIVNPQGEILFTRRKYDPSKGMLDLPGGFVDPEETAESAARREVYEELNLKVDSMQYIGSSNNRYLYGGIVYFTLDLGFECKVSDFSTLRAGDDAAGYVFLAPDKINIDEIGFLSIRTLVQLYIRNRADQ
jgi:ADP-ribose pyrophosphatase YjhB (NUDIX family)